MTGGIILKIILILIPFFSFPGEYDAEIQKRQNLIAKDPTNLDAHYELGNFLSWDGRYQEAIGVYENLLAKEPKYTEAEVAIGRVYAWMGDQEKAKAMFLDIANRYPNNYEAYQGLGSLALWANDFAASIGYFERALNLNSKDIVSLKGIGRAYLGKGDRRRAEEFFTRAQILEVRKTPLILFAACALFLGILGFGIFWLLRRFNRSHRERILKLELNLLRSSLDFYRQNTGSFPLALEHLMERSWRLPGTMQDKRYLEEVIGWGERKLLVDSFGNRFWYSPDTGSVRSATRGYENW